MFNTIIIIKFLQGSNTFYYKDNLRSVSARKELLMTDVREQEVFVETAYAEYGSALEMLAACKLAEKSSHAYGYFEHAKDEYNHTKIFLELLAKRSLTLPTKLAKKFRFNQAGLVAKGYVSKDGYLIERMNTKDFVAYVYTNELLAKESFSKILKLVGFDSEDGKKISLIMKDELRHHGMAKEYFLKYFPKLQPWQLLFYQFKETINNKGRKLYRQNLLFLEKIFYPIYLILIYIAGNLLKFLDMNQFKRKNINLMDISPTSML